MDRLRDLLNGLTGNLIAGGFVGVYLYRQAMGLDIQPEFSAATLAIAGVYFAGRAAPAVLGSISGSAPPKPEPRPDPELRDLLAELRAARAGATSVQGNI